MSIKSILRVCCVYLAAVSVNANAALMDSENGLIFDDDLGITWLANANLADTEQFGVLGINLDGGMTWNTAIDWISAMNAVENSDGTTGYLGFTGWRLPTTVQPDDTCSNRSGDIYYGTGCERSEMGHLFNVEGVTSSSPGAYFENVQDNYYWSGTEFDANDAWRFSFLTGDQSLQDKSSIDFKYYAWAVHDGEISIIPVPAAAWLFASGLLGLIGVARRKN